VVGAITVVVAAVLCTLSLVDYYTFKTASYDLVIFDQAIRSYSHFHLPVSLVKGMTDGFGPNFSLLGDHWSPVLVLLAPLYWIHGGPTTLLVAQAVLLALAVPPLWVFTRRELGVTAAYCVVVAYGLSWPVATAAAADFHEVAFAPVLLAVLFERLSAYRRASAPWWHVVLAALAALTVKEDMGFLVCGLGLALLVLRRWRLGAAFMVGGLAYTWVAARLLIPAFGGNANFYWAYGQFGKDVPSAVAYMIIHPVDVLRTFVQPGIKAHTMTWLLAVGAFAPLVSPYVLVVLPPLAERMLAAPRHLSWWVTGWQYNAFLVVPLLCAGVDGVVRLQNLWVRKREAHPEAKDLWVARRIGVVWAAATLAVALWSVHVFSLDTLIHKSTWQQTAAQRAAAAAVAKVPDGALVEAANYLGPQLSGRARVMLWGRTPFWAPWIVAEVPKLMWPFCSPSEVPKRMAALQAAGYQIVFQQGDYVVLHRPGPDPVLKAIPNVVRPCLGKKS